MANVHEESRSLLLKMATDIGREIQLIRIGTDHHTLKALRLAEDGIIKAIDMIDHGDEDDGLAVRIFGDKPMLAPQPEPPKPALTTITFSRTDQDIDPLTLNAITVSEVEKDAITNHLRKWFPDMLLSILIENPRHNGELCHGLVIGIGGMGKPNHPVCEWVAVESNP